MRQIVDGVHVILVDSIMTWETKLRNKDWSHMVSTECPEELHAMADRLGLRRVWFQQGSFDHYDVTPPKRRHAISLGAVEVDTRILLFANYDYARRRPRKVVPERYAVAIAELHRTGKVPVL